MSLFLLLVILFPSNVFAQVEVQPGQYFAWDHDGIRLDHFETNIDFVEWQNIGLAKIFQIPVMQASLHTFYVRACGTSGPEKCSDPLSIKFLIIDPTLPNMPSNLRIIITLPNSPAPAAATPSRLPTPPPGQVKQVKP
jgi:hypothetical protein